MKQTIIIVLGLAVIIAGMYWLTSASDTNEPTAGPTNANNQTEPRVDTPDSPSERDRDYVGLSETEAEALAAENEAPFRVVERDGEPLMVTEDYRPGRINAVVESGVVVSYRVEGEEMNGGDRDVSGDSNKQGDPNANRYDFGKESAVVGPDGDSTGDSNGEHDAIIGMTEAEAAAYAEANEVPFRIGVIDGELLPVTMDYRPGRITATIENGIVIDYSVE